MKKVIEGDYFKGPKLYEKGNININAYHKDYIQFLIEENIIWLLLMIFCSQEFIWKKEIDFSFTIKKIQIEYSSLIDSRHNFTKAKRSFEKEKNEKKAKKNLIHGLRYLNWAVQILEKGEIYNVSEGNELWFEIKDLKVQDWMELENKVRPFYRQQMEKVCLLSKPKNLPREVLSKLEKKLRKESISGTDYVIEYIKHFSLNSLTEELSIFVKKDPKFENLFFVTANPVSSPKNNIIVKYCANGLLLSKEGEEWKVIAFNHPRFLSWERQDCDKIDWKNCVATEMSNFI